jgi:hypothetical protein
MHSAAPSHTRKWIPYEEWKEKMHECYCAFEDGKPVGVCLQLKKERKAIIWIL